MIEEMVEASKHTTGDELNPFKEQMGEILPSNLEIIFSGILVRKDAISFKVNSQKLLERIAILNDQLLIAKFVGPKPSFQPLRDWLQTLELGPIPGKW